MHHATLKPRPTHHQVIEERICDDDHLVIKGGKTQRSCCCLLRGANMHMLDEVERSLHVSHARLQPTPAQPPRPSPSGRGGATKTPALLLTRAVGLASYPLSPASYPLSPASYPLSPALDRTPCAPSSAPWSRHRSCRVEAGEAAFIPTLTPNPYTLHPKPYTLNKPYNPTTLTLTPTPNPHPQLPTPLPLTLQRRGGALHLPRELRHHHRQPRAARHRGVRRGDARHP